MAVFACSENPFTEAQRLPLISGISSRLVGIVYECLNPETDDVFGCQNRDVQEVREHQRRKHLFAHRTTRKDKFTFGIDFENCAWLSRPVDDQIDFSGSKWRVKARPTRRFALPFQSFLAFESVRRSR